MKYTSKKIGKFCRDKGINLVKSKFENQSSNFYINWNDELSKFLDFIDKSNCQFIFLDELVVQHEIHKSELEEANITDVDLLEDGKEILSKIKKLNNKVIQLAALISVDGTNVIYSAFSEYADDFFEQTDKLDEIIELGKNTGLSEPILRYHDRRKLMKPFAIQLAKHKDYYRTLINDEEQYALMDKIFGDTPDYLKAYDKEESPMMEFTLRYDIKCLAKAHFKIHIEPELEKEFIEKIKEWKKTKTPKVEMASKLGLSVAKLNSYYYKA